MINNLYVVILKYYITLFLYLEVIHTLIYLICQYILRIYYIFFSECFFQCRFVSIVNPKKLNSSTLKKITLSILSVKYCISLLGTWQIIYLDFDLFRDNLFIFNHSITVERSAFIKDSLVSILFPKYAKLLNSGVSSACIINLNILLACKKSLIYYMINNKVLLHQYVH